MTIEGYTQQRLNIHLDTGKIETSSISEDFCTKWIGGYGFGAKVLWDELKPGIDPFSPDNILVWAIGPYPGTILPTSSKYGLFAKSPLTGLFGMSISSGSIAQQARRGGHNLIVFYGKSEEPVYVMFDDDDVQILPCKEIDLWGKGAWEADEILKEHYADSSLSVAAIGPAGEKLSKIGCITNDRNRQAGRTGMGGVMGSKNLKALCFRGTKSIKIAKPKEFYVFAKEMIKRSIGTSTSKYREYGTPSGLVSYNDMGMLGNYNFREGYFDKMETFSGQWLDENLVVKKVACSQCTVACDHLARVPKDHQWAGAIGSMDIENCYALGSNCGHDDWYAIIKAITLCDDLGMDTISAGTTVAFAMECFEKGIITKKDVGYDLSFGNSESVVKMIEEMGNRSSKIGDILADGSRAAAQKLGGDAIKYSMQVKGLEFPMFDIHGMSCFAVGASVSIRGACHLRNGAYGLDAKGKFDRFGYDKPVERGKGIKDVEDEYAVIDSLIICKFTRGIYNSKQDHCDAYNLITGYNMTPEQLMTNGEAIHNLAKCFNIREGATKADDYPPERFFTEAPTRGPAKGVTLDKKGYTSVLEGYYEARGWDREGIPTDETLKRLGLDFVIGKLKGGKK
jgi:aldehyde:ferredoxin oxidoreductase